MKQRRERSIKMRIAAFCCVCLMLVSDTSVFAANLTEDPLYEKGTAQANYNQSENTIDAVGDSGLVTNGNFKHDSRFANYTVRNVIDVSYYQGDIDWNRVKAAGIDDAFIRIGYRGYGTTGNIVADINYKKNLTNAIAAGVNVGVYFFSQATTNEEAKQEADFVLERIQGYQMSLPVVIDYEYATVNGRNGGRLFDAKLTKTSATNVCKTFCAKVASAGYTPMLYANKDMLLYSLDASSISANYKIWLARYSSKASYSGAYQYWQYSEGGSVDGITGSVDCSFYYDDSNLKAPKKTKITYLKSTSKKKATIKWKKVSSVSGYEISYSTNKKYKNAKKITVKSGTKYTIKKLTSGKKYYFRIRVYNEKLNGKKVYSGYVKKTVTVK